MGPGRPRMPVTRGTSPGSPFWPLEILPPPKLPVPPVLGESPWHTGQHSPSGIITFSQLVSSSHWISSQRT